MEEKMTTTSKRHEGTSGQQVPDAGPPPIDKEEYDYNADVAYLQVWQSIIALIPYHLGVVKFPIPHSLGILRWNFFQYLDLINYTVVHLAIL